MGLTERFFEIKGIIEIIGKKFALLVCKANFLLYIIS